VTIKEEERDRERKDYETLKRKKRMWRERRKGKDEMHEIEREDDKVLKRKKKDVKKERERERERVRNKK